MNTSSGWSKTFQGVTVLLGAETVDELTMFVRSFCHVNVAVRFKPCEYRLFAFTCSESYLLSPMGTPSDAILPNCGNGLRLCATVFAPE